MNISLKRLYGRVGLVSVLVVGIAVSVGALTLRTGGVGTAQGASKTACKYYLVSFQGPENIFMSTEQKGALQAGKDFGIPVVFEGPPKFSVPQQVNLLRDVLASHPCGVATGLADPKALNAPIMALLQAKIPVVLWNVQDFKPGSGPIGNLAYVGQDELQSGTKLASHLAPMLKKGVQVVYGVDYAGELVAQERYKGVKATLAAQGISTSELVVGANPTAGVGILQAYLQTHPNVKAIVSNGATTAQAAALYVQQKHLQGKVTLASFDMAPPIVTAIKSGIQSFALDQQPYLQGYMAMVNLFLYHARGFQPVNVNTGTFFVDKTNVAAFEKLVNAGVGA
jgi:simple sugar transport system substrate-binding protein